MNGRAAVIVLTCLTGSACAPEPPAPPTVNAQLAPASPSAPAVERRVEASPAVKALLRPDPDLEGTLTPEEIKETLAAAQISKPKPDKHVAPPRVEGSGEWQRLEAKQSERNAAYRARLEATTVFVGPDGSYHSRACPRLYILERYRFPSGQYEDRQRFAGIPTTLASVLDRRVTAHDACSPPSVAYTY